MNGAPYIIAGLFAFFVLLAIYRRREAIGQKVRQIFMAIGGFLLAALIARQFTIDTTKIFLVALLVEFVIFVRTAPRRSRYIPRSERRKAIARYEESGKRYDSKRHHIDHKVPYSRGGGNTADNLRVLESEKNLAKSARSPWWDIFG